MKKTFQKLLSARAAGDITTAHGFAVHVALTARDPSEYLSPDPSDPFPYPGFALPMPADSHPHARFVRREFVHSRSAPLDEIVDCMPANFVSFWAEMHTSEEITPRHSYVWVCKRDHAPPLILYVCGFGVCGRDASWWCVVGGGVRTSILFGCCV